MEDNNFGVIDLWVLRMGGGYKETKRVLLSVKENQGLVSPYHEEITRDENKVITEQRVWDNTYTEGDTQFEYDCDGSQRKIWEEKKPQYIKDGFNYLIYAQREWTPEEYDAFIKKNGKERLPFLSMCLDNAKIIYSDEK